MSTQTSLSFLIITSTLLSVQATTAQKPSQLNQNPVANNTLKTQVLVAADLPIVDQPIAEIVPVRGRSQLGQTDVFLSDVAKTPRKIQQISATPAQSYSEDAVEIIVPRPLTQFIKKQPVKPLAQVIKVHPAASGVTTLPISIPQQPVTNLPATANSQTTTDQSDDRSPSALLYPLTNPARVTSRFGWRTHPLTGSRRFHSGLDIGAPAGAPVVATGAGVIISAGWNGGYGKAVIIQHSDNQQTLYGHLSEISVQAGQSIAQGTVVGLVGSTGHSTGPHLHFETRMPIDGVWTAVDPSQAIQYAVDTLRRSMPYARKELPLGI